MTVLITGVAGFIGMHVADLLLRRGDRVIGIDTLNAYYDPALKDARLETLTGRNGFSFEQVDFADGDALAQCLVRHPGTDSIVHLGAQAGVRHSIDHPEDYVRANLVGHFQMMEAARRIAEHGPGLKSFVYASSSSVYGANKEVPFSPEHRADHPMSFYGATKKSAEVMSQSYAHLYRLPMTGLRFFTVYGPWGRPDMSPILFAERILSGQAIRVFNNGDMRRDFTYIDDIASGVLAALDQPPSADEAQAAGAPHRIYNLGNNAPVALLDYIGVIEAACGQKAVLDLQPMQPGDVPETFADISATTRDLGWTPTTPIDVGIPKFVEWYKQWRSRA